MRQVPEPDRDEWVRRLRERARLDAEELVPRPSFPVFGLTAPELRPAVLAETQRTNGQWESVALAYGDWADPAGPFVTVTTTTARADGSDLDAEADLVRVIDRDRNRIADHAGVYEHEPPAPPEYAREELSVGERHASALVCRHGSVWAARLAGTEVTVTVAARGVAPGSVRLEPVADLDPYLRERGEMLGQLTERHRRQPPPALAPAQGVAAYRALVEATLESQARLLAALHAGREPRRLVGEGALRHALWQRAVREQARISGISAREADEVVTLVVNHVTHLQEQVAWFAAEPRLRAAAIDETLRYAVLGEDVRSKPAQEAWARYWVRRTSLRSHEPGESLRAELAAAQPLISGWLGAWSAWAGAA
jgi:hypothetical protein